MDREKLERKYRPHLFGDCWKCGANDVRLPSHVCNLADVIKFQNPEPTPYQPDPKIVMELIVIIRDVFTRHGLDGCQPLIDDLARTLEPKANPKNYIAYG